MFSCNWDDDNVDAFDPRSSIEDLLQFAPCQWSKLDQELQVARAYFVAMLIPDEITDCS